LRKPESMIKSPGVATETIIKPVKPVNPDLIPPAKLPGNERPPEQR
jgi:hypothetical protein